MNARQTARRIIANVAITTADDLVMAIRDTITRIFPESYVRVKFSTNISPTIHIVFAFERDGWPGGIIENDRAFHRIFVGNGEIGRDGTLPPKLKAELLVGGAVYGPNVTNKVRVGWRNRTGTPEQIVKHLTAYFDRLSGTIQSHPDA